MTNIVVFADAPLPGQCLKPLIPFNDEGWLARLYAAMLRDTLDGLEAIPATRYLVVTAADEAGRQALERHLPLPWELALAEAIDSSMYTLVARPDAPAAQLDPLFDAVREERAVVGLGANGEIWLVGSKPAPPLVAPAASITAECMLPAAIIVDTQPSMEALFEELRQHHERAPRTAIVSMTS